MKIFKKLSAVAVATVMGCSVLAFTACTPNDGENGGGGDGSNGIGAVTGANAALINGVLEQEVNALNADINVTVNVSDAAYNYVNGEKGEEIKGSKSETISAADINLKANLETGNFDLAYSGTEGPVTATETSFMYAFLRSGHLFANESKEEITDFSETSLLYMGALKDFMELPADGDFEIPEEVIAALEGVNIEEEIGSVIEQALGAQSYAAMALANAFGALTVADGKATVDVNKAIYNAVEAVKDFVDGITLETTVSEILNDATLKGVLTPFINLIAPADLVKAIKDNLKAPDGADAATKAQFEAVANILNSVLLDPEENETTYDYLVRVISSEELLEVINAMLQAEAGSTLVGIDKTVDKWTLGNILGIAGVTEEQFNAEIAKVKSAVAEVAENVTQTSATFESLDTGDSVYPSEGSDESAASSYYGSTVTTFENVKFVYTLSDNKITGQAITAKITITDGYTGHSDDPNTTSTVWSETNTVSEYEVTLEYEESVTLEDINEVGTVEMREIFTSETKDVKGLKVTSVVDADGNLIGITAEMENKVIEFDENNAYHDEEMNTIIRYEVSGATYDFFGGEYGQDYAGSVEFKGTTKFYSNTVAGILAGTASVLITE